MTLLADIQARARQGLSARVEQQADITVLTDSSGGTANNTLQLIPVITDSPASADALRDDIVTNVVPVLKNNYADLAAKVNEIIVALRAANVLNG